MVSRRTLRQNGYSATTLSIHKVAIEYLAYADWRSFSSECSRRATIGLTDRAQYRPLRHYLLAIHLGKPKTMTMA